MEFLDTKIMQYAEAHTSPESEVLRKINRETNASVLRSRMLSGHLQGRLLSLISHLIKPQFILEIGTYTGYSAVCLAEGLSPGGTLVTIDINEELEMKVRNYFQQAHVEKKIDYRIGNALTIIPQLTAQFDLVFIDADKENYSNYFDLVINKVPSGGYILADNVLWSGKILDDRQDRDTRAIVEFNHKIQQDLRVDNLLLPVRDGMMIMRKI